MWRILTVVVAIGAGALTVAATWAAQGPPGVVVEGGTVSIHIEHSRFDPDRLVVRQGATVEFRIENGDPIAHEFIIGDAVVHADHENGTERKHPPVPGEISVRAGESRSTIFTFSDTGRVTFACHLPGHLAYGMAGVVDVVA